MSARERGETAKAPSDRVRVGSIRSSRSGFERPSRTPSDASRVGSIRSSRSDFLDLEWCVNDRAVLAPRVRHEAPRSWRLGCVTKRCGLGASGALRGDALPRTHRPQRRFVQESSFPTLPARESPTPPDTSNTSSALGPSNTTPRRSGKAGRRVRMRSAFRCCGNGVQLSESLRA
jgi:hypothetical protein